MGRIRKSMDEKNGKEGRIMNLIGILLDVGNVVFFLATFPQLISTYRNRKKGLKAVSSKTFLGFLIATLFFISVGALTGGYLTVLLGIINEITFGLQLYWKWKYR